MAWYAVLVASLARLAQIRVDEARIATVLRVMRDVDGVAVSSIAGIVVAPAALMRRIPADAVASVVAVGPQLVCLKP